MCSAYRWGPVLHAGIPILATSMQRISDDVTHLIRWFFLIRIKWVLWPETLAKSEVEQPTVEQCLRPVREHFDHHVSRFYCFNPNHDLSLTLAFTKCFLYLNLTRAARISYTQVSIGALCISRVYLTLAYTLHALSKWKAMLFVCHWDWV